MASTNGRRKHLSVEEKVQIIREIEAGKRKTEVAAKYNLVYQTVVSFWRNRERIVEKYEQNARTVSSNLDEELFNWLRTQKLSNGEVSDFLLKARAEEFSAICGLEDFECTDEWLESFKRRHGEYFPDFEYEENSEHSYLTESSVHDQDLAESDEQTNYLKGLQELLRDDGLEKQNSSVNDYPNQKSKLKCLECDLDFADIEEQYEHLLTHVSQPAVNLTRVEVAPLRIKIKSTDKDRFEIVQSSEHSPKIADQEETAQGAEDLPPVDEDIVDDGEEAEDDGEDQDHEMEEDEAEGDGEGDGEAADEDEGDGSGDHDEAADAEDGEEVDAEANVSFSPNFAETDADIEAESETEAEAETEIEAEDDVEAMEEDTPDIAGTTDDDQPAEKTDYTNVPGAEPTPPPEPSPEYPKIRIKSGLLKESLTITEITDDNPKGEFNNQSSEYQNNMDNYNSWATPSLEDPLRIPDAAENDSSILSNLFNNNNDRAKDLGFTTSETEFISMDQPRNSSNALAVFSSANSMARPNPLDSLSNLPMQQLAQQVSRLQPNGNNGMHQQNVLINIQQFPQAPPQPHTYQPHMYPPHPPQPMYHQPYQPYQPPNPALYYSQGYHMPPPPRPQMPPQMAPPSQQMSQQQPMHNGQSAYRQPQPRQPQPMQAPRQPMQGVQRQVRPGMQPRGGMQMQPRQYTPRQAMGTRQRAPMVRGRGGVMMGSRGPRPRMAMQNGHAPQQQNGPRLIKRSPESIQAMHAKRKKMDVLVPDKHDDADCQVIAVQPKNTGLPQIQSIQGNAPEPTDNSVMHLSDSITLSVRNPTTKPPSPKKTSDAKDVANILATRGITVTATPKAKDSSSPKPASKSPEPPVAINLNSSVCIIPTAKNQQQNKSSEKLTTVDLTDDTLESSHPPQPQRPIQKHMQPNKVLPFQCDLCPAKYPNSLSLNKHRQSFHKTGSMCDYGIPLIDLKTPGVVQKLANLGIHNYIPLPGANTDSTFALPIINTNTYNKSANLNTIGATSVLTLGPVRVLPRVHPQSK